MSKPLTILLHQALSPVQINGLQKLSPDLRIYTREDLAANPHALAEAEILYGNLPDADWPRARALRWVQAAWVGVDDMLTPAFLATKLPLYKSAGVNARCMIESVFAMILAHNRRLHEMYAAQQRREWLVGPLENRQLSLEGKTLALLGVGTIGGYAAEVGRAFQMRIVGCRASGAPHPLLETMYSPDQRREFFAQADVLLNTMPLTPATRGFIGQAEFGAMKPGALFVNVGRGASVETPALIKALHSGHLGAAILDVFDTEPLPPDDPLWQALNIYISPHCTGHYPGRWERSGEIFLENVARYLRDEPLLNPVDLQKGY